MLPEILVHNTRYILIEKKMFVEIIQWKLDFIEIMTYSITVVIFKYNNKITINEYK